MYRDPSRRLGVHNDGQDIRDHPWFECIDWHKIYHKEYTVLPNSPYMEHDSTLHPNEKLQKQNQDRKETKKIENWTFILDEK